ncbi:MAG: metal-binding protein, partial [Alcanivorax sp.]|nr:metal-binding protein [Alcanivorax sp.]
DRLLAERQDARGLTVPGMPVGSPGMEMGDRVDAYDVLLFDENSTEVFSHYPGN